jgi:hypothetical protein
MKGLSGDNCRSVSADMKEFVRKNDCGAIQEKYNFLHVSFYHKIKHQHFATVDNLPTVEYTRKTS